MKTLLLLFILAPWTTAKAGGGATGRNEDVLITFSFFVLVVLLGIGTSRLRAYLVKRYKIYKEHSSFE